MAKTLIIAEAGVNHNGELEIAFLNQGDLLLFYHNAQNTVVVQMKYIKLSIEISAAELHLDLQVKNHKIKAYKSIYNIQRDKV